MSRPKKELSAQFNRLLGDVLNDPHALRFWELITTVVQHFDDIYDGDTPNADPATHMEVADMALIQIPANPFFRRFQDALLPVIRKDLQAWEHATMLEESARRKDRPPPEIAGSSVLRYSFEMRNSLFDLGLFMVELLHGRETRRRIAMEFMEISRAYEDYPDYVEKIMAPERPEKIAG